MKPAPAVLLLGTLLAAGCASTPNPDGSFGAPGSQTWFATASQEAVVARYRPVCMSYGFAEGSPGLAQCVAQEVRSGREDATAAAAARSAAADGLIRMGNAMANGQNPGDVTCSSDSSSFPSTVKCTQW